MRRQLDRSPSLMEFIVASIDEAIAQPDGLTGREVYLRGVERYERHYFEQHIAAQRRALEREMPLLGQTR